MAIKSKDERKEVNTVYALMKNGNVGTVLKEIEFNNSHKRFYLIKYQEKDIYEEKDSVMLFENFSNDLYLKRIETEKFSDCMSLMSVDRIVLNVENDFAIVYEIGNDRETYGFAMTEIIKIPIQELRKEDISILRDKIERYILEHYWNGNKLISKEEIEKFAGTNSKIIDIKEVINNFTEINLLEMTLNLTQRVLIEKNNEIKNLLDKKRVELKNLGLAINKANDQLYFLTRTIEETKLKILERKKI